MSTLKIGVVGYCPPTRFDETEARRMLFEAYARVHEYFGDHRFVIVSGLTNVGVIALAYELAVDLGWKTVGIACKRALKHPIFPVDEQIVVGEDWGDESSTFIAMLDGMIRIGGGEQSLRETAEAKKRGLFTIEYNLSPLV